jgi:hypothetical protein
VVPEAVLVVVLVMPEHQLQQDHRQEEPAVLVEEDHNMLLVQEDLGEALGYQDQADQQMQRMV